MELIAKHPPLKNFTIPRKIFGPLDNPSISSTPKLFSVPVDSNVFQKSFAPIFMGRISTSCNMKEQIKILDCIGITNEYLEQKFNSFRKRLEESNLSSEVTYGFMVLSNISQQVEVISERGMRVGNFTLGEVGDAEKGVYLVENPDLVVPSVFFEPTTIRIMCFKVVKGRCRTVDLGSYKLEPSSGYNCHVPPVVKSRKLSRYVMHRFSQIYLFESSASGKFSKTPANVLPFAVYTVKFFPLASAKFNLKMINVWSGSLKSGPQVYYDIGLYSAGGVLLKPLSLLSELQIPALVDWTSCLKFPFIQELLSPTLIGDLCAKKELYLSNTKQYVSYYILSAADMNEDFVKFVEIAQVHRVIGYQILDSDAHILLIPNGSLSMALCLPYKSDPVFHCLHLSRESCINGLYKPLDEKESAALNRDPLTSEKIDGLNKQMEEKVFKLDNGKKNDHIDHIVPSDASKSAKRISEVEIFENKNLTRGNKNDVSADKVTDIKSMTEAKKFRGVNMQKLKGPKNTIRKTKVVTSSSLMDPRLTVSEHLKKRQRLEKMKNNSDSSEKTIKKLNDSFSVVHCDEVEQVVNQKEPESTSLSCSSYAYQAPVPQVALVIEKMKDPTNLSPLPEETVHVDRPCQKTISEKSRESASKVNDVKDFFRRLSSDLKGFNAFSAVDKKAFEKIETDDPSTKCKGNSSDENSDVDLRITCISQTGLAKIMSNLRSRCQNVEDSEVHRLLSYSERRGSNSTLVSAALNNTHHIAINGDEFVSTKPSLEREVKENFYLSPTGNDSKNNFDSLIPFETCYKESFALDEDRDMDYRLNTNVEKLLNSMKENVTCPEMASFNSTMLPV